MLSTFTTYQRIAADIDGSLSRKAADRSVALESDYYRRTIGSIKSIDDFVGNTRLFKYAMKAFGLEEMDHAKGFIRKILEGGVADEKSLANRLADDRFVRLATTFDFAANGEATTDAADATEGVVDRYVRQSLEVDAGEDNEGVRLALYFQREAPKVTSAYGLLADPALWEVVKTVYGFPAEMGGADIDKQKSAVDKRLDVADLKDPEKLARMIQRFTASWDATQATSDPVLDLFTGGSGGSVSLDLVMTLHNLRHGGG